MPHTTWIKEFVEHALPYGVLWWVGGVAMYLNQVRKGKQFKLWMFCINVLVAGWLWIVAKDFIPATMGDFQYSLVSLVWFLAFPILDWIEDKGLTLLINKLTWAKK